MKQYLLKEFKRAFIASGLLSIFFIGANAQENVGINTTTPHSSASLEISSGPNKKGLLIPQMALTGNNDNTTVQPPIAYSLLVYNTNDNLVEGLSGAGYYYNTSMNPAFANWVRLGVDKQGWLLAGNNIDNTAFLGTTNTNPLVIKTNLIEAMRINSAQLVGMGKLPTAGIRLDVNDDIQTDSSYHIDGSRFLWNGGETLPGNTFVGNTLTAISGTGNTFVGSFAGRDMTFGTGNVFIGRQAAAGITGGSSMIYIGHLAGVNATAGSSGTVAIGGNAGRNNQALGNVFIGNHSGEDNTVGLDNVFIGRNSGDVNISGSANTFIGSNSGTSNTSSRFNTFVGANSGEQNVAGNYNTFMGSEAGKSNISGGNNTFIGTNAGRQTLASRNTFLGFGAGSLNTSGNGNTFIGADAGASTPLLSNATAIGIDAIVKANNNLQLGDDDNTVVSIGENAGGAGAGSRLDVDGAVILGANGNLITNVVKVTFTPIYNFPVITPGTTQSVEVTIPNVTITIGSTVTAVPTIDLPDGAVIAWARVSGSNKVKIGIANTRNPSSPVPNISAFGAFFRLLVVQ